MYVCIAVSVCLCLSSKLRESGEITIVAMFIIKAIIFLMMPLMMTMLRHFTQQLNQICLYGDTMSIGQGQPIPQTRRCRQKNVVFGCFSTSSLSLLPSLLAQGSLSREAPREQRRSWSKSSLLSPRAHLIFLLQLSSSRLWGQLLAWHLVQVYLRESSNRITETKKILTMQCKKKSVLFE